MSGQRHYRRCFLFALAAVRVGGVRNGKAANLFFVLVFYRKQRQRFVIDCIIPPFTRAHARGDFLSLLLRSFAAVHRYFTRGVGAAISFRKASQYSPLDRVPALQVRSELALCCRAYIHKHIAGERLSAFALPADIYCALSLFGSGAVKKPCF